MNSEETTIKKRSIWTPLLITTVVVLAIFLSIFYAQKKCNGTVYFSVGEVDNRFKTTEASVETIANEAADRWNGQTGEKLLAYNQSSKLKINLVYDDRQANLDQLNEMSTQSINSKRAIDTNDKQFKELLSDYESDLNSYNAEVASWNKRGGAPKEIFNQLNKQKSELDQRRIYLNQLATNLNIKINDYNQGVAELNNEINTRKNIIITQGLYKPTEKEIDIYTFGSNDELRLVLMHELGHALDLGHTQGTESIMYYMLGDQNLQNPTLSGADISELNNRCKIRNLNIFKKLLDRFLSTAPMS